MLINKKKKMFTSKEFITAWQEWKEHKKEKHGQPYTAVSERKALATLWQKSHGVESLAIESLNWCMEMNWSGIYIKSNNNGSAPINSGNSTTGRKGGTSTDRMEALRDW